MGVVCQRGKAQLSRSHSLEGVLTGEAIAFVSRQLLFLTGLMTINRVCRSIWKPKLSEMRVINPVHFITDYIEYVEYEK